MPQIAAMRSEPEFDRVYRFGRSKDHKNAQSMFDCALLREKKMVKQTNLSQELQTESYQKLKKLKYDKQDQTHDSCSQGHSSDRLVDGVAHGYLGCFGSAASVGLSGKVQRVPAYPNEFESI